jgi:phosphate transport system permease protein
MAGFGNSSARASDRLYLRRRITNAIALSLSCVAAVIGLAFLAWILWTLVSKGITGINWELFTRDTPPPMAEGGLRNALFGSAVMCVLAILIGAPLGVAAGTWLGSTPRKA